MMRGLAQTIRKRIVVEDVEPRLLYSADALAVSQLLVEDTSANNQLVLVLDAENQQTNNATQQPPVSNSSKSDTTQTKNTTSSGSQSAASTARPEVNSAQQTRQEIVFVDSRVQDYQQLVKDIQAQGDQAKNLEVVMIDAQTDGLRAILETLKARQDVDAIHLLGEGAEGQIYLGNNLLDANSLDEYERALLTDIGTYLNADADVLIYACNFAHGEIGQGFVAEIASLTQADVAASDDVTGHQNKNGDWVLEYYAGKIDAEIAMSASLQQAWVHALGSTTPVAVNDVSTMIETRAPTVYYAEGNGDFGTYDATTGAKTLIGNTGLVLLDIAVSQSGEVYATNGVGLYKINPLNASTAFIGATNAPISGPINALGFAQNGALYAVGDGSLYSINMATGNATAIASFAERFTNNSSGDLVDYNNALYFTAHGGGSNAILRYDLSTASITSVAMVPTQLYGLSVSSNPSLAFATGLDGNRYQVNLSTGGVLLQGAYAGDVINGLASYPNIQMSTGDVTPGTGGQDFDPDVGDVINVTGMMSGNGTPTTGVGTPINGTYGQLILNADGTYSYALDSSRPATIALVSNQVAQEVFTYRITDQSGNHAFATLTIHVTAANDAVNANLIQNGSFEDVTGLAPAIYGYAGSTMPGWTLISGPEIQIDNIGSYGFVATDGTNQLDLKASPGNIRIAQDVQGVQTGRVYALSFAAGDFANADDGTINDNTVTVYWGGQAIATINPTDGLVSEYQFNLVGGAGNGNNRLEFEGAGRLDNAGVYIDNVRLVNATNNAPSGADSSITINEDTTHVLTAANFGFTDIDGHSLNAVRITTLPTLGTLTLNGVAVIAGQTITLANINSGLLVYTPVADGNGNNYTSFTFQVQDNGGTANGGVDVGQTPNTISFNVMAVNDAPSGTNSTLTTNEDSPYTFTVSNFGFSDVDGNNLNSVRISTLPNAGTLSLNGVALVAGQSITVANISAGLLVYTPVSDGNGNNYTSFTFQVQDNGGTANGGVDVDQTPNTISFNVLAVNDAPSGTNSTLMTNEDSPYTFTVSNFGFSDADGNNLNSVRISNLPNAGTLTLNSVGVTVGQIISIADINAGLLTFTPANNANGNNYSSFTFQVQDNGGTANGGIDLDQSPNTISFNVTALNDAPSISSLGPQFTTVNSALYFNTTNGNRILIGDVDVASGLMSVSLSVTQGQFTLASVIGLSFTVGDGVADASMVFTGTLSNINAAFNNAFFTPNNGYTGGATLAISVNDLGNQGAGGAQIRTMNTSIQMYSQTYQATSTAPNQVNQNTTLNQSAATPLRLDDGRILYVWINNALSDDNFNMTVQGRIFNADGTASTNQFQIGTSAVDGTDGFDLENLSLTKLNNGNVVIGWVRSTVALGGEEPVFVIINPSLAPTDGAFVVMGETEAQQTDNTTVESPPIIKALADGKFVVVWSKNALEDGQVANTVVARIFNANGTAFSGDIPIGTWAVDGFDGYDSDNITVTQLAGGNIVVAYVRATDNVGSDEPVFTVINASGVTVRADVEMQQNDTTSFESPPIITALSDGRFMAVWVKNGVEDNSLNMTIQGRIFNADGTPATNEFQVGSAPADGFDDYDTDNVVMTQLDNGNVVVGFVRNTSVAGNDWPFFSIINPNITPGQAGFAVVSDVQINTTNSTFIGPPVIVALPNSGGLFAVVRADINANSPIYARLYNGVGQPLTNEVLITSNANNLLSANNGFDVSNLKAIAIDSNSVIVSWVGVSDGDGTGAYSAIVNFNIVPVAANNTVTTNEDVPYVFTAANFNFSDADSDPLASIRVTSLESAGRLLLNGVDVALNQVITRANIDAGLLTFVPASNINGIAYANFGFTVSDGSAESILSYTMTINVNPVTDLVATNDSASGAEDTAISGNVSLNDSTTSGGVLTYAVAAGPSNGNLTLNANGTYSYQGNLDYNGLDSFTYTVTDAASGESLTRLVSLTITQVNDTGTFGGNLSGTGNEDTTITGTVTFTDPKDGYTTSNFALQTNGANGVASINNLGQWTYTPNNNFNGADSFTIRATDDDGNIETQTITINVQSVNDAPTSSDTSIRFNEDSNFVSTLPAAFDLDGDAVTYSVITQPSHGAVVVNANGSFSFSPALNYNGADQFSFMISDGQGGTAVYLVTVTLDPVNDLATTSTVVLTSMAEDTVRTITQAELLINASDVDGNALSVTSLGIGSGAGSLSDNGNGTWTYTPARDDDSSVYFVYTISDGQATVNGFSTLDITPVDELILIDRVRSGTSGTSAVNESANSGSETGSTVTNVNQTVTNTSNAKLIFLEPQRDAAQKDNNFNNVSSNTKDSTRGGSESGNKQKNIGVEFANNFSSVIFNLNASNELNVVSTKWLGLVKSYNQANFDEASTLAGGLSYEQSVTVMTNTLDAEQFSQKQFVVNFNTGAQVSTAVFSAGLMAWATQYTGLFASLFASLPAWSALDPMPILNKQDNEDELDSSTDVDDFEDDEYGANRVLG